MKLLGCQVGFHFEEHSPPIFQRNGQVSFFRSPGVYAPVAEGVWDDIPRFSSADAARVTSTHHFEWSTNYRFYLHQGVQWFVPTMYCLPAENLPEFVLNAAITAPPGWQRST